VPEPWLVTKLLRWISGIASGVATMVATVVAFNLALMAGAALWCATSPFRVVVLPGVLKAAIWFLCTICSPAVYVFRLTTSWYCPSTGE
jgi:hypothetical protein